MLLILNHLTLQLPIVTNVIFLLTYIHTKSIEKVIRIGKMIVQGGMLWYVIKFSQLIL